MKKLIADLKIKQEKTLRRKTNWVNVLNQQLPLKIRTKRRTSITRSTRLKYLRRTMNALHRTTLRRFRLFFIPSSYTLRMNTGRHHFGNASQRHQETHPYSRISRRPFQSLLESIYSIMPQLQSNSFDRIYISNHQWARHLFCRIPISKRKGLAHHMLRRLFTNFSNDPSGVCLSVPARTSCSLKNATFARAAFEAPS